MARSSKFITASEFFDNLKQKELPKINAYYQFIIHNADFSYKYYINTEKNEINEGISQIQSFVMSCNAKDFSDFVQNKLDLLKAIKEDRVKVHGNCAAMMDLHRILGI